MYCLLSPGSVLSICHGPVETLLLLKNKNKKKQHNFPRSLTFFSNFSFQVGHTYLALYTTFL